VALTKYSHDEKWKKLGLFLFKFYIFDLSFTKFWLDAYYLFTDEEQKKSNTDQTFKHFNTFTTITSSETYNQKHYH